MERCYGNVDVHFMSILHAGTTGYPLEKANLIVLFAEGHQSVLLFLII